MRFLSCLFLCVFITPLLSQTNWRVNGYLSEQSSVLSYGTVYLMTSVEGDNKILSFSATDEQGYFELILDSLRQETFLVCNYLGYKPRKIKLSSTTSFPLKIEMTPQEKLLQEVVVSERKWPIQTKGDTVIYNLSDFRDSTEHSIEEVLRKLPGIQVEANGRILVSGQAIDKMLIEGTDLFGRQYTIGSKNIRADLIESVEVIDHYQENSVIKDIISSESIVLNLKLKEDVKNVFSGVVNVGSGFGTEWKMLLNANVFSISPNSKMLLITDNGNTGTQYGAEEIEAIYFNDDQTKSLEDPIQPAARFTEKNQPNNLDFKRPFVDNSKNSFTTLRSYFDLGNSVKVNVNAYYALQRDGQQSFDKQAFLYEQKIYENNLAKQMALKNTFSKLDFKLSHINAKNTQSFDYFVALDNSKHQSYITSTQLQVVPENILSSRLDLKNKSLFAAGLYTLQLRRNSFISILNKNNLLEMPEKFSGNNPDYSLLFPVKTPMETLHQELKFRNRLHELSTTYFIRFKSFAVQTESSVLLSKYTFDNKLLWINTLSGQEYSPYIQQTLGNWDKTWTNALTLDLYLDDQTKLVAKLSGFYRSLRVGQEYLTYNPLEDFSTSLAFHKTLPDKMKLYGAYEYLQTNLPNYDFLAATYFSKDFAYQQNSPQTQLPSGHHLSFRISKVNTLKLSSFYMGGNVRFRQNQWIDELRFFNSVFSAKPILSKHNNSFRLYSKLEYFIPSLKMNVEVQPTVSGNQSQLFVEGQATDNQTNNFHLKYRLSAILNPSVRLSLDGAIGKMFFKRSSFDSTSRIQISQVELAPHLALKTANWNFSTSLFYRNTFSQNQKASLLGTNLKIDRTLKIAKKTAHLSLTANNLFNTKSYSQIFSSDYFITSYQVEAIPAFFILAFDCSF